MGHEDSKQYRHRGPVPQRSLHHGVEVMYDSPMQKRATERSSTVCQYAVLS
jgi:hypothetical protein